jgi:hypothetical protein
MGRAEIERQVSSTLFDFDPTAECEELTLGGYGRNVNDVPATIEILK